VKAKRSVGRTEWIARAALAFVVAYGLIALTERPHERFPFFAFDLFTKVPPQKSADYDVRIIEGNGLPRVPVFFEDAHLQDPATLIQGYFVIQQFGKLLARHNGPQSDAIRKQFESTYLSRVPHARYEVVVRTYDIRKRISCRSCFTKLRVLGAYTTS
jgi:hypothetical protein